jgi:ABC-2 type transport system ATP-binding protein
VSATEFSGLPGVADVVVEGDRLRCTATGRIDGLVKTLARHEVRDFISHEPTLEETFIAYYGANSEP